MSTAIDGDTMARPPELMIPKSCKAARALLGMGQQELADLAGISLQTLRNYENEESQPTHPTWLKIKRALEKAGIQFIDEDGGGAGVRLRQPGSRK